jgi:phospholipid/cholesterol/gamma-HCH transport system substrate-binding protein
MEPEAKYTIVGAAVLILVALLAAAIVWLRSSGEGANAREYKIYFERQSLEGLETRSEVTMRGVRAGSVMSIRFSSARPGTVEVLVALDPSIPVRRSTSASVERHLVTGLANVRLSNATEDSPLLTEAPPGEQHPVIAEGENSMHEVSDTLAQLAQTADETMKRLDSTLSPQNRAALAETLENLRRASTHADATLARADASLASVGKAADDVRAMADDVRTMAAAVTSDANKLATRYDTLGADATVSVREIGEAARKISADVDRLTQRTDSLLAGSDEELQASARALRSAADSVGTAADRLRDPRQAIYGPPKGALGPGEGSR